jgi:predicted ester cyclase
MSRVVLIVLATILCALASSGGGGSSGVAAQDATPTDCVEASAEENEAISLRWHEEVINGQNLDVIDEIVTPDVIHHAGTFPDGQGPDAIELVLGMLLTGFPDAHHTVEQVISDGDRVVTVWRAEGTHEGEFQGYAPTGTHVTWTGINVFRFECGLIAEEWSEVDGLGRLRQMGVLATPTP